MKILAIDSCTHICSVALLCDEQITQVVSDEKQHNHVILSLIQKLLARAEISLSQLHAIAFCQGPGSFTGVRLAASVAQGLSFAVDLPVIAVTSLAALAEYARIEKQAMQICAAMDARMQAVYWALYTVQEQQLQLVDTEKVTAPSALLLPTTQTWVAIGNGFQQYQAQIAAMTRQQISVCYDDVLPTAHYVALLAKAKYLQGDLLSTEQAIPYYVRDNVVGH